MGGEKTRALQEARTYRSLHQQCAAQLEDARAKHERAEIERQHLEEEHRHLLQVCTEKQARGKSRREVVRAEEERIQRTFSHALSSLAHCRTELHDHRKEITALSKAMKCVLRNEVAR